MTATLSSIPGGKGAGGDDTNTRLTRLETKLETIIPTLATKTDVSEAKAAIVMWLAGVIAASTAIIIAVLAFMLNRAVPPPQPAPSQSPIVIYPQAAPQSTPSAPQALPATKGGK